MAFLAEQAAKSRLWLNQLLLNVTKIFSYINKLEIKSHSFVNTTYKTIQRSYSLSKKRYFNTTETVFKQ